jgi:hypothetical protein
MGVSSGTLRILALTTALLTEPRSNLIGIEEPENYVHPTALRDFAQHLLQAKDRVQFVVTTHSPLLLDFLDDPAAVRVVQRGPDNATTVLAREDPDGIRRALDESGFGLGEYYETRGFGARFPPAVAPRFSAARRPRAAGPTEHGPPDGPPVRAGLRA